MIPEGDAICIAFSNIWGSTKSAIALGYCRTFLDLDEREVRMEREIRDRTPPIYQSTEDRVEKHFDQEEYRYRSGQYITVNYYSSETHDRR